MPSTDWDTQEIAAVQAVTAPDGSLVRILCATARGSTILFSLDPGAVSRPVAHRTVEEIWYVVAGQGRLWRKRGERQEIVGLGPGISLTIPPGTHFQFRNDGAALLDILAVTMPPWPGDGEAYGVSGAWPSSL